MNDVRQGCVHFPNFIIKYLLRSSILGGVENHKRRRRAINDSVVVNNTRYADDTVLLVCSQWELQRPINAVVVVDESWSLFINAAKTNGFSEEARIFVRLITK